MINYDLDISLFDEGTWVELEKGIKENAKAQENMRNNLYCMWFPDTKEAITISQIVLHDIDNTCDKIIASLNLNNLINKESSIEKAFERLNNKLSNFDIRFDKEYIDLKIQEAELNYDLLWAKKIAKDIEQDRRELLKEQEREEKQLLKDKEKAERKLSQVQYTYARQVQLKREKQNLDELQRQIEKYEDEIKRINYSLQNSKAGYVYVVSNDDMKDGFYKIGVTRRDVYKRMNELAGAGHAYEMNVHGAVFCEDIFDVESKLHRHFTNKRVNKTRSKKEWFKTTLGEIQKAFKEVCDIDIKLNDVKNEEYIYAKSIDNKL